MLLTALTSDTFVGALQRPELVLPNAGLTTLPSLAMECVLSTLDARAALNLAMTCKACAAGFAEHRLGIAKKVLVGLMPKMACPPVQEDGVPTVYITWSRRRVVHHIYALSDVPGALKALWAAVWQMKPSQVCFNQHNLAKLMERDTHVLWEVLIASNTYLQIPYFWLQDEFLGAAAATFADNTGCQMEPVHAQLMRPSNSCGSRIMRKMLRFNRQTNSHTTDTVYGSWWSSQQTYIPTTVSVRSKEHYDANVVAITGAWCDNFRNHPAAGDHRSPQDLEAWTKAPSELPFGRDVQDVDIEEYYALYKW